MIQIKPAGAKAKSLEKVIWDQPGWIAEEKYNGWRFLQHFGSSLERVYMTGRRVSSVTDEFSEKGLCAPSLWVGCRARENMKYTILDGEVLAPVGASFHDIAGIMNVDPEDAAKRIEKIGVPRYRVFDCLHYNGRDIRLLPLSTRRMYLQQAVEIANNPNITVGEFVHLGQQNFYDSIVKSGGEGVILKDLGAEYGEDWLKIKKFHDLDVIVTGWKSGKGKYVGQIGAAIVSVRSPGGGMIEVGKVSGMTDDVRLDMTNHPERWLGKVIEVRTQEFGRDRLLHPRFRRARPDADPSDATWTKMLTDLGIMEKMKSGQLTLI